MRGRHFAAQPVHVGANKRGARGLGSLIGFVHPINEEHNAVIEFGNPLTERVVAQPAPAEEARVGSRRRGAAAPVTEQAAGVRTLED